MLFNILSSLSIQCCICDFLCSKQCYRSSAVTYKQLCHVCRNLFHGGKLCYLQCTLGIGRSHREQDLVNSGGWSSIGMHMSAKSSFTGQVAHCLGAESTSRSSTYTVFSSLSFPLTSLGILWTLLINGLPLRHLLSHDNHLILKKVITITSVLICSFVIFSLGNLVVFQYINWCFVSG